jgi:hypothetical protein
MQIFRYDSKSLQYVKLSVPKIMLTITILIMVSMLTLVMSFTNEKHIHHNSYEKVMLVDNSHQFTRGKLEEMLGSLNLKFPHIALAQTILETGEYKSKIFKENKNLFGMKQARTRTTLAEGTQYGHAYYKSWSNSVLDYAFWVSTYAHKCKTESQFYQLLDSVYAEDGSYTKKLKSIVSKQKLKEIFE